MRNTTKVYAVAALAGGCILAAAARADAAPACNSFPYPVYIAGSSASRPILQALANQFPAANPPVNISIIYEDPSSCQGLTDLLTAGKTESKDAAHLDGTTGMSVPCDPTNGVVGGPTSYVDIGVSDVFPQTCVDYSNIPMLTSGQKDWWGPIQAMVMAVQSGQTQYPVISAEAAYVAFGWSGQGGNTVAPWTDPKNMFIRSPTSGTESMIGKAIGLAPTKWLAQSPFDGGTPQQEPNSGAVVTALTAPTTNMMSGIGILSTQYVDQNRSTLHALAFQAKDPNGGDQECGYLPDSSSTTFDKLNVRQGRYGIWGPLHFVTNVDGSGKPQPNAMSGTRAVDVQTVISYLTFDSSLSAAQNLAMIQASAAAFTVPPCAMQVSRMQDGGGVASTMPTGAMCGCYYEALAAGKGPTMLGTPTSSYCHQCTTDTDCSGQGNYKKCNYGFCEVQ
jgi:ABC-type phosphate transport system substrate-binding protein